MPRYIWRAFSAFTIIAALLVTVESLPILPAHAAGNECQSNVASGNWNAGGSWTNCGGTIPDSADNVTILNGHNITVNVASVAANVTINTGGTITVSGSNSLTISGSYSNSGTFSAGSGTVTFNATTSGKTVSGSLNGTNDFNKIAFNGVGGEWTITDPIFVSAANATDAFVVSNGTVTLGDGNGDNLDLRGKMTIANTANQTAAFETVALAQGSTITIDVNQNAYPGNPPQCANCTITVGATSGSGQGTLTIRKNTIVRFNPREVNGSISNASIQIESTGKADIQGSLDSTGTDTGTDPSPVDKRVTKVCSANDYSSADHSGKKLRISNANSLAFGFVYDIAATTANDSDCATNTDDSLTINDTSIPSGTNTATIASINGSGSTRKICSGSNSYINTEGGAVSRYISDLTGTTGYLKIVASTNNDVTCSNNDSFSVIAEPAAFSILANSDAFKIVDGVRSGDTFEVIDYAHLTGPDGTNCGLTSMALRGAYGNLQGNTGSETILRYAHACNLGSVIFDNVNGANSNEGVTIDHGYFYSNRDAIRLQSNNNNNSATNSKGVTYNNVQNSASTGITTGNGSIFLTSNNNSIDSNIVSGQTFSCGSGVLCIGIGIRIGSKNTVTNNRVFNNPGANGGGVNIPTGILIAGAGGFGNNIVTGNDVSGSEQGISIVASSANVVSQNKSYANVLVDTANTVEHPYAGIYVASSSGPNTIESNQTLTNESAGIYAWNSVSGTTFYNNSSYANEQYGLYLRGATSTVLNSNQSYDNIYGLGVVDSTNVRGVNESYGSAHTNSGSDVYYNDATLESTGSTFTCSNCSYGSSTQVDGVSTNSSILATLATGYDFSEVVGIVNDSWSNPRVAAAFYNDGKYSVSTGTWEGDQAFSMPTLHDYTLPAGYDPSDIIGIAQESWNRGRLAVFFADGKYAASSSPDEWDHNADVTFVLQTYTLAAGKNASMVVGVALEYWFDGIFAVFYNDGTYSVSSAEVDASTGEMSMPTVYNYTVAAGKTPSQVIGVAQDSWNSGRLGIFYNDGTYSSSASAWQANADISAPNIHNYTLAGGQTASDVIGIEFDAWNSGNLGFFYDDETYSVDTGGWDGTADITATTTHNYTLGSGYTAGQVVELSGDWWNGALIAWYNDGTYGMSSIDIAGGWDASTDVTVSSRTFTLAAGKTAADVAAITFNDNNGDLVFIYDDGTYSSTSGSEWEVNNAVSAPDLVNYSFNDSHTSTDVVTFAYNWNWSRLFAFYTDGSNSATSLSGAWDSNADAVLEFQETNPSWFLSRKDDGIAGATKVWGKYSVPDAVAETPQIEQTHQLNYTDSLWPDSFTAHSYTIASGAGTEDTNLNYAVSGSFGGDSSAYTYLIICNPTANCVSEASKWDVYRNGTLLTNKASTGSTYTDTQNDGGSAPNIQFKIDDAGTDYTAGATYQFTAFKSSGDANTQKVTSIMQDQSYIKVGTGKTFELKGQSAGSNLSTISRGGSGGYSMKIQGTIDAQYYSISYLGSTNGGKGLELDTGATVTNLANGAFTNFQNAGSTDSYIYIHSDLIGSGTPTKDFASITFTEASDNVPEYSVREAGGTAGSGYWNFSSSTCTGWASCEASDSDTGSGNGTIRFGGAAPANVPGTPTVSAVSSTSINVKIDENGNDNTVEYAMYENNNAKYVQTDGTLGASAAWQTYTNWGGASGKNVTGLGVNTANSVKVKARNSEAVETAFSSSATKYTLATTADAPTVTASSSSNVNVKINPGSNPTDSSTKFSIKETGSNKHVQTDGTLATTEVKQTHTNWGGSSGVVVSGLTASTTYTFTVSTYNGDDVASSSSASASATTSSDSGSTNTVVSPSTNDSPKKKGESKTTTQSPDEPPGQGGGTQPQTPPGKVKEKVPPLGLCEKPTLLEKFLASFGWKNSKKQITQPCIPPSDPSPPPCLILCPVRLSVAINPDGGTYLRSVTAAITHRPSSHPAKIYYTLDDSEPNQYSLPYRQSLFIDKTTTVKAKAYTPESPTETAKFTITFDSQTPPTEEEPATLGVSASPTGGTYDDPVTVSLTATDSTAKIYYTTDGSTPTAKSHPYIGPVTLSESTLLSFYGETTQSKSDVGQEQYILTSVPAPVTIIWDPVTSTDEVSYVLTCNGTVLTQTASTSFINHNPQPDGCVYEVTAQVNDQAIGQAAITNIDAEPLILSEADRTQSTIPLSGYVYLLLSSIGVYTLLENFRLLISWITYLIRLILVLPPFLLGRRGRPTIQGVVKKAGLGSPIFLAIVTLVDDDTGRTIESTLTMRNGRFAFAAEPGRYHLTVAKPGYSLTKNVQVGTYHGEVIALEPNQVLEYTLVCWPVLEGDLSTEQAARRGLIARAIRLALLTGGTLIALLIFLHALTFWHGVLIVFYILSWLTIIRTRDRIEPLSGNTISA